MGDERAQRVVALQTDLMRASRLLADPSRALAAAAALDYVLMLARGAAGARIPAHDAERAVHDGIAKAVDALLAGAREAAASGGEAGRAFARAQAASLSAIVRSEGLDDDERRFALIVLANT